MKSNSPLASSLIKTVGGLRVTGGPAPNPEVTELHQRIVATDKNLEFLSSAAEKSLDDFKAGELKVATALSALAAKDTGTLGTTCSQLGDLLFAISELEPNHVSIDDWERHVGLANTAKEKYDKASRRNSNGEALFDAEKHALIRLRQVDALKQFELVEICSSIVDARIEYLTKVVEILNLTKPVLAYAKEQAAQNRKEFAEAFAATHKVSSVFRMPPNPKTFVFGAPLSLLMDRYSPRPLVPRFIEEVTAYIEQHGMKVEGIFRINSSRERRESIRELVDSGKMLAFEEMCDNPHTAAGLLMQYLRELPQPAFYGKAHTRLRALSRIEEVDVKISYITAVLTSSLHIDHLNLLHHLFHFLYKVALHEADNKMSAESLAIVLLPNVISNENPTDLLSATMIGALSLMIGRCPAIFSGQYGIKWGYEAGALFDYEASSPRELTLRKGDVVFVFRTYSEDWVQGMCKNAIGLVPLAYLHCQSTRRE